MKNEIEFKQNLEKTVESLKIEIAGVRCGRASPSLVENLIVETYSNEAKLKLLELSTITTEGPSGLLISPFDPATVKDIEKAILSSPLNLTPRVDGKNIHIAIPPLSEEQRRQLLKIISQKIEAAREQVRTIRDEARKKIKMAFENKEISEDQKFRTEKEIDKITQDANQQIEQMREKKEKEVMEI